MPIFGRSYLWNPKTQMYDIPAVKDTPAMRRNNPNGEPVGNHTGRCRECGSKNLWDDNLAYGCNDCGAMLGGN